MVTGSGETSVAAVSLGETVRRSHCGARCEAAGKQSDGHADPAP